MSTQDRRRTAIAIRETSGHIRHISLGGDMVSGSERIYHLMRLSMGRYPSVDASVTLQTLIAACNEAYGSQNDIVHVLKNSVIKDGNAAQSSNAVYMADLDVSDKHITILLVRGDPTTGTSNYTNVATRAVIPAKSEDPDAVPAVSCHILIERSQSSTGAHKGRHRMVLEKAANLGRSLVKDYLSAILDRYAKNHPDQFFAIKKVAKKGEKPKEIEFRPTVRFYPQQNASLKNDLKNGKIGGFTLMRGSAKYNGPADAAHVVKSNVMLHASVAPTGKLDDVLKTARNMAEVVMPDVAFDSLKLELVDAEGNRDNTQLLSMESIENSDMRYCRSILDDNFKNSLEQCYASIQKEIAARAKAKFSMKSYWE